MDDNTNPCGEFGERCYSFSKEHVLTAELTCADFVVCHFSPPPNYEVFFFESLLYCPSQCYMFHTVRFPFRDSVIHGLIWSVFIAVYIVQLGSGWLVFL